MKKIYTVLSLAFALNMNAQNVKIEENKATSDLFFSEYVEGSGYNKAIEIANFTGEDVDLSQYVIKLRSNSNADWTEPGESLTGTLAQGDVFVITNNKFDETLLEAGVSDLVSSVTNFNGNDDLALYKNGVLIDMFGYDNVADVFSKDMTLRRKSSVNGPTTTYDSTEWEQFAKNDVSGLGTHTYLSIRKNALETVNLIYPNPSNGKVQVGEKFDLVSIFDLTGRKVFESNYKGTSLDLSTLAKGLYIAKFKVDGKFKVQKIQVN